MVRHYQIFSYGCFTGLSVYVAEGLVNSVIADLRKDFGDVELRPASGSREVIEEVAS